MSNLITLQEISCEEHFTMLLKANATLHNGISTSLLTFIPYCLRDSYDAIEMGIGQGFKASGAVQCMRTEMYALRGKETIENIGAFAGREYDLKDFICRNFN